MAAVAQVIIANSEEGRGAFGIRCDNDQNVYFPMGITEHLELEEFETVEAIMVGNDRPDTPWRAIRARRLGSEG